ncbi:hypothetical protein V1J52_08565 [Streptomyces sp. TRM 70351]|uniref:hypothetical protein n=1 Tax=Streptomyces sp. TRM 70351 TaxID=3116552 RepID=UPI002E7BADF3|nr:hypothetical protein [Streptomyces sp. TRM 70351]MEE1928245.1 hypothetical protein [Streptomyces sp. TRM 70351]
MIAGGLAADAECAAEELREALAGAGVSLPGVHADPRVWDDPGRGPVRLVELGSVLPGTARHLAGLVRKGAVA